MSKTPFYVKLAHENGRTYRQYRYDNIGRANINERRKGIWQFDRSKDSKDKERIYITSPCCGTISNLSEHVIDRHGYVYDPDHGGTMGCVICNDCGGHFFVRLKGWKDRRKAR